MSLLGPGSVCESLGPPRLKCSSGLLLLASEASLTESPSPDEQPVMPTAKGEQEQQHLKSKINVFCYAFYH